MKTLFTILAIAFTATTAQAQDKVKEKPAESQPQKSSNEERDAPKARKEADKMEGFDLNFRHQVERTQTEINTLGGRLVPAGKKRGEGC